MNNDERRVLLLDLVEKLNRAGSWTGETHIQKAIYFLSILRNLDLGYSFVLYKYGPYSFDLKSELTFLEATGILERKESPPYGSHFSNGKHASSFRSLVSAHAQGYERDIAWTIDTFFRDHDNVSELERYATALYALKNFEGTHVELADRIHQIKPHISKDEALSAINRISKELV